MEISPSITRAFFLSPRITVFNPGPAGPHRPQTKGKIERPFAYLEGNLLNGRTFTSLEHLNEVTTRWLADTADVRLHRETKRRPIDLYEEERPHLITLPAQPYDTAQVLYRTVNPEGYVAYLQNFYSVPGSALENCCRYGSRKTNSSSMART